MSSLSSPRPSATRRPVGRPLAWLLFLCWLATCPATAGSLQVSPILLEFEGAQQAQGIWLSNTGPEPLRAQVRVREWSQKTAGDVLADTDVLVASPPILEIAPGERQLVRIVRLQANAADVERAYRLLIDELPAAKGADSSGLLFLLRYSVPVFLLPTGVQETSADAGPRRLTDLSGLSASLSNENGNPVLTLGNAGRQRLRLSQLVHVASDGARTELVPGLLGYVLAGQQMSWNLPLPGQVASGGVFEARFNNDAQSQTMQMTGAVH